MADHMRFNITFGVYILQALGDNGGVTLLGAGARGIRRQVRYQVEQILVGMLDLATAEAEPINDVETPLDWASNMQNQLRWARAIAEDTFFELFVRLCEARREWHLNKREPFDTKDHGDLAHSIDDFHQAASASLVETLDDTFLMALNPSGRISGERVGNDPAAAAPHTQKTGAHAAAGEPHPQTPSASGGAGEDEDGDVQMSDGEEDEEMRRA
ncbi:hypothetical protein VMCG_08545 [Cytospora schulzeri]|uniref:Uncharacterized protein n=1 Tax=Cytospora schulzeri TaxID=448051 RepID=A0A423VVW7_9PEZI|nr:hypothetical protein VMCG_08545 [Valsa malicola]